MNALRTAIIGCGTAGPAAAALLARQGHAVTLIDKAPALHPLGAGLLLQPTGLAVLESLGCRKAIRDAGSIVHRLHGRRTDGKTVLDLRYADLRPDLYGVGIGRGVLLNVLLSAAQQAGATLQTGIEIAHLRHLPEGSELLTTSGEPLGLFDLILLADGSRSTLVGSLGLPVETRSYQWGALWFIGERDINPHAPAAHELEQVYDSTTGLIGVLPSGRLANGKEAVSLFYSIRTDRFDATRNGDLEAWKRHVTTLHPQAGEVAAQVKGAPCLLPAVYREVVMPRWHSGRVAVLGDAGHSLSPLLGMGANMALVDAHRLAECIHRRGVADGLRAYSDSRRQSIATYQRICRWMTPLFQSDLAWLAHARDLAVPFLCRWGWSKRQALHTVAGVKRGLLTADPLPPIFAD